MAYPLPPKFRIPPVGVFDGNRDPFEHLETYKTLMHLLDAPYGIMCKAFPTKLKGLTQKWFGSLKPGSVSSFAELS